MTREYAIKILKFQAGYFCDLKGCEEQQAFTMAIKALKQESCTDVLDKIRAEFISLYPKNYAGELELGGASCAFSLNKVLNIIDKYKAKIKSQESEG